MIRAVVTHVSQLVVLVSALIPRGANAVDPSNASQQRVLGPQQGHPDLSTGPARWLSPKGYALPGFYHSYAQMRKELLRLGGSCGLDVQQKSVDGVIVSPKPYSPPLFM